MECWVYMGRQKLGLGGGGGGGRVTNVVVICQKGVRKSDFLSAPRTSGKTNQRAG